MNSPNFENERQIGDWTDGRRRLARPGQSRLLPKFWADSKPFEEEELGNLLLLVFDAQSE